MVAAIAAALVLCAIGAAQAAERIGSFILPHTSPDMIGFDGVIDGGTIGDFHRALAKHPKAKVVVLQSPGGDVDYALSLAAEIRRLGLGTAVPRGFICYSACTFLYFAGREHMVHGKLGVHRVSSEGWNEKRSGPVYDADVRAALRKYGAAPGVIEAMARTPSSDIHVFSAKEIAALSINRAGSSSLVARYAAQ